MTKPYESWVTINVPLTVKVMIYPGDPGVRTYKNGDPGYPPTPPEFDFEDAWIGDDSGPWKINQKTPQAYALGLANALRDKVEEATGYEDDNGGWPPFQGGDEEC